MAANQVIKQLTAPELESALRNSKVLIVGGTAGLGKALAVSLLSRGAQVTVVGRRSAGPELAKAAYVQKDLSLLANASALADELDVASFNSVVFTTGIFAAGQRQVNGEGIELDMAVSFLNRLVFMRRVLAKGEFGKGGAAAGAAVKPRVFVMGFPGVQNTAKLGDFNAEKSYSAIPVHMTTVVGNEALVSYLNGEFKGAVNVYGLNPGIIRTEIRDNYLGKGSWLSSIAETIISWFTPSPEWYAENTLVHVVASKELEDKPGALIDQKRKILAPNPFLTKDDNAEKVIAESIALADRALSPK